MAYRTPLEARVAKKATQAICDFNLIEDGDRIWSACQAARTAGP
jgi:hypothetical protein